MGLLFSIGTSELLHSPHPSSRIAMYLIYLFNNIIKVGLFPTV